MLVTNLIAFRQSYCLSASSLQIAHSILILDVYVTTTKLIV